MSHDVIVCGAGPAGAAAARRLAAAGARVALLGSATRPGWEGLSARSRALLAEEGLDQASDVIAGPFARRGVWADRPVDGIEWLAERSLLAEALCSAARSAGVDHRRDTVMNTKRVGDCWCVRLRGGAVLTAPTLIDARGRRGRQRRGPPLLAIGQGLRRAGRPGAADKQGAGAAAAEISGTGIGVADFGWCWWAEHGHALWVQVIARPGAGAGGVGGVGGVGGEDGRGGAGNLGRAHPAQWMAAAAAQIPALARALKGASVCGPAVARPAHARLGVSGDDSSWWRAGDCAMALDPLSGQGIYEALRSARLVAAAIQSVWNGAEALSAHRSVTQRYAVAWLRGVRAALEFYRENGARGAFWRDTAAAYAALLPMGTAALVQHAALDAAAAAPGSPPQAIASTTHWLPQTGALLQPQPRVSPGG